MTYDEKVAAIEEAIKYLNIEQKVDIYNDYAEANNYERIYCNDEETLNMLFASPADAITHLHRDYREYHDYCMIDDSSGLLRSSNYPYNDGWIFPYDIAKWLLRSSLLYKFINKYDLDLDYDLLEGDDDEEA